MLYEDFLKIDDFLSKKKCAAYNYKYNEDIRKHNEIYVRDKLILLKDYFDNMYKGIDDNIILDLEQRKAVLMDEDYVMILAGAGSGKTTTVAAKVKFLVDIKKVNPDDIIIISYTNQAVIELKKRINNDFKIPVLVCTFHKFGIEILKKDTDEHLKILEDGYNIVKDYFEDELCKDKETLELFLKFFVFYFDIPSFALKFDNLNSYINHKKRNDYITLKSRLNDYNKQVISDRSKKRYTILGEFLRSTEEVMIANFLYLNNIDYDYEMPYPKLNKSKTYVPDFTIRQGERVFYLEHFGVNKNGYNKLFNFLQLHKYQVSINNKRKLHTLNNTTLLETYSSPNLLDDLEKLLISRGIILNKKCEKDIYNKLVDTSKDIYYARFIIFCLNFIRQFKTNGYTDFNELKNNADERTILFLNFIEKVYNHYQTKLASNHYIDFEDMINKACDKLDNVKLNYKYIIIDEYQDISKQRFNLAHKISKVSSSKIIAVGDDWQSIFAFAGSDMSLFTKFKNLMGYALEAQITNTYRNSQELIDVAGTFVMCNQKQIKKNLKSPKNMNDPVMVIGYNDKENKAKNRIDVLNNCLEDIKNKFGDNQKVLLLGRYNFEKYYVLSSDLFYELSTNKIKSIKFPNFDITFMSAHSSKGLGYDQVIVLNGDDGTYGFPSQIKDDPIMQLVNVKEDDFIYAEERRLFYVALTRTKNKVYILTPINKPSVFILELIKHKNVYYNKEFIKKEFKCPKCNYPLIRKHTNFKINNLHVCSNESELCDFKTNNLKYLINIKNCPDCNNGLIVVKYSNKKKTHFLACTNFDNGCNHTENLF